MYETALNILKQINNKGYKAYIVGGYPRDLYLRRESIDIDICTDATPKELKEIFQESVLPKQEYGGITIISNNIRFEITTFRKEIKYENNRFPVKIKYIHVLLDDLKRRDFTINTLCIDEHGETLDLLNALPDLENRVIRSVGSADHKIKEDILRSLRAIRFATVFIILYSKSFKILVKMGPVSIFKISQISNGPISISFGLLIGNSLCLATIIARSISFISPATVQAYKSF